MQRRFGIGGQFGEDIFDGQMDLELQRATARIANTQLGIMQGRELPIGALVVGSADCLADGVREEVAERSFDVQGTSPMLRVIRRWTGHVSAHRGALIAQFETDGLGPGVDPLN